MDHFNTSAGSASVPAAPAAPDNPYFTSGNPSLGVPATVPGPYWFHMISQEIRNVLIEAGLTPDHENLTQLHEAIEILIAAGITPGVEPGSVIYIANNSAPSGYLKANGALISRATYANLFAAIGTTFGAGDGSTTFALPDLRGEFMRGWDDSRGIDSGRAFGSSQSHGIEQGTFQVRWDAGGSPIVQAVSGSVTKQDFGSAITVNGSATGRPITEVKVGNATETRPRNIALLACIKF